PPEDARYDGAAEMPMEVCMEGHGLYPLSLWIGGQILDFGFWILDFASFSLFPFPFSLVIRFRVWQAQGEQESDRDDRRRQYEQGGHARHHDETLLSHEEPADHGVERGGCKEQIDERDKQRTLVFRNMGEQVVVHHDPHSPAETAAHQEE